MLLISKEWRDSGWGNFICSEKQKRMGNIVLRSGEEVDEDRGSH